MRELTGGDGTHAVVECVGTKQPLETALGVVRDGGVVSRLGVLDGTIRPGKVFDRAVSLEEVPEGYRVMADRKALKVLIGP